MSDNTDQHDGDPGDGDQTVTMTRANIRKLEKAATAGSQAQQELAALKREMAFRDAGINPGDAKSKYFIKGYDGETSVEAIKAAAIEAGFLQASGQAPDTPAPSPFAADLAAMSRANDVTAAPQQPTASMEQAFHTALQAAKSPQEIMAVVEKFNLPTPGLG